MDVLQLRATASTDIDQSLSLCRSVAATPNYGLARHTKQMGRDYVEALTSYRNRNGISIVTLPGDALVGEIHTARMLPRQFSHVLTDLTITVHP